MRLFTSQQGFKACYYRVAILELNKVKSGIKSAHNLKMGALSPRDIASLHSVFTEHSTTIP